MAAVVISDCRWIDTTMVDTQHFCLRWNNYQSSITSAFENLRDDEDFVDVTLACDGKSLKAHRVVLSACSPYFRELLKVRFASLFHSLSLSESSTRNSFARINPCVSIFLLNLALNLCARWVSEIMVRFCVYAGSMLFIFYTTSIVLQKTSFTFSSTILQKKKKKKQLCSRRIILATFRRWRIKKRAFASVARSRRFIRISLKLERAFLTILHCDALSCFRAHRASTQW